MIKSRIGIIGCGGIADGKHMPSIAKLPNVDIVAFCDIVKERAIAAAKKYGTQNARVYTDYNDLLKDPQVNNVRVLTWNPTHCRITEAALNAGKDVLCEKPMALTYEEAQRMVQAAKKNNRHLSIGYQHRFDLDVEYTKQEVLKGTLGDIYFAKARVIWRRSLPVWRRLVKNEQGGGSFIDIGTHALDTVLWLMDNYKPRYACATKYNIFNNRPDCGNRFGTWKPGWVDVEDSAFGFIVMDNGATILLESSYCLNTSEETRSIQYLLAGTKAGIDNFGDTLKITGDENGCMYTKCPELQTGGVAFFAGKDNSPSFREQECFENAIRGNNELRTLPEEAACVVKIIEGLYYSAETGKPYFFE